MISKHQSNLSAAQTSVMLLAAGRGERMLELTDNCPKPLLQIGSVSLIEQHLIRLAAMGFKHFVINLAYLGDQIQQALGDGSHYSVCINYSDESKLGALETAGGILNALPLLESDPFLVVNADIWTDFDFLSLLKVYESLPTNQLGCLTLVNNPQHNPAGDFHLSTTNDLYNLPNDKSQALTFSGIALYQKSLFADLAPGKSALAPLLRDHIDSDQLSGIKHSGEWTDVGTPQRLAALIAKQRKDESE